ncbi:hypothetical protein ALPO108162_05490 [Alicyclobacillus pomorum]
MSAKQVVLQNHPDDNVAVALVPLVKGEAFDVAGKTITVLEDIPRGHKVALAEILKGQNVMKYGYPFGHATSQIATGAWVHTHNVATNLSGKHEYEFHPVAPAMPTVFTDVSGPLATHFDG